MSDRTTKRASPERESDTASTAAAARAIVGVVLLGVTLLVTGCMALGSTHARPEGPGIQVAPTRVLIMEPTVRLWVLTVGGVRQPHAEWTAAAHEHVRHALTDELRARGIDPVLYSPPDDADRRRAHDQMVKLHRLVFGVASAQEAQNLRLPTKRTAFDWTLGDGVRSLHEEYGTDHALFVAFDDSYQSAGAIGSTLLTTATLGLVAPPPGQQVGAASLVNLRTGHLVWMRHFLRRGAGDLRQLAPARTAVSTLLKDLPR